MYHHRIVNQRLDTGHRQIIIFLTGNGKSCKLGSHITSGTCASDVLCELVYQNGVTLSVTSDMTLDQLRAMVLLLN